MVFGVNVVNVDTFILKDGYLYLIGGMAGSTALSVIDLTNTSISGWTYGPYLNEGRTKAVCIVDEETDILYAIGGEGRKTVETLAITLTNSSWRLLDNVLPSEFCCGQAMMYGDYILLIGSETESSEMTVLVIDRFNHSMYSADGLSFVTPRVGASSIIIDGILYVFSGDDMEGNGLTSWEYACLDGDWYVLSFSVHYVECDGHKMMDCEQLISYH